MDWLEAAFGFGAEAEPAAPVEPPRRAPEIQSCWVVIRQPSGDGDHGSTVPCHWYVEDETVTLCDERGKPDGNSQRLSRGDDPRVIAKRLKRNAWHRENERSAFNRPLRYPRSGLA